MSECETSETVIDVRQIPPRMRHTLVLTTFGQLGPGGAFRIVNDHDPRPLLYQFCNLHPGEFDWTYEQSGPDVWQVRIGRAG
jgi:uncharacterized protein (DUF2249 family)